MRTLKVKFRSLLYFILFLFTCMLSFPVTTYALTFDQLGEYIWATSNPYEEDLKNKIFLSLGEYRDYKNIYVWRLYPSMGTGYAVVSNNDFVTTSNPDFPLRVGSCISLKFRWDYDSSTKTCSNIVVTKEGNQSSYDVPSRSYLGGGFVQYEGKDVFTPSDEDIKNFKFNVGEFHIISPTGDLSAVSNSTKYVYFESYGKFKTNVLIHKAGNTLEEIRDTITFSLNGQVFNSKDGAYFSKKYLNIDYSSVGEDSDGKYIYNFKITGNIPLTNFVEGKNTLSCGFNWIDEFNIFAVGSKYTWFSDSIDFNIKFYIDENLDGIDDNTGEHIPPSVDSGDGTFQPPDKPGEDGSILDWITYYINVIFESIKSFFSTIYGYFTSITSGVTGFAEWFQSFYSFLPDPIPNLISSAIIVIIFVAVIKVLRG